MRYGSRNAPELNVNRFRLAALLLASVSSRPCGVPSVIPKKKVAVQLLFQLVNLRVSDVPILHKVITGPKSVSDATQLRGRT
jgi:hypothetical protein